MYPYGYAWVANWQQPAPVEISPAIPPTPAQEAVVDPLTGEEITPATPAKPGRDAIYRQDPAFITGGTVRCLYPAPPEFVEQACALTYQAPDDPSRAAQAIGPVGEGLPAQTVVREPGKAPRVEVLDITRQKLYLSKQASGSSDFGRYYTQRRVGERPGSTSEARAWSKRMLRCGEEGFVDADIDLISPGNYKTSAQITNVTCRWWQYGTGWYEDSGNTVWQGCDAPRTQTVSEWVWKGCTGVLSGQTSMRPTPPVGGVLGYPAAEPGETADWDPARCINARCTWLPEAGYDPSQLKVTVIGQNATRTGVSETVLLPEVTQEPEDLTDALSDKMWLAKADGATAYRYSHFLDQVRWDQSMGDVDFIGTVWQTTDSATPWRLSDFSRKRLDVLDEKQPFRATTVGAGGAKVSPLVVVPYSDRGADIRSTLGPLPVGMSRIPEELTTGKNDLILRFYAPGNVGGLDDKYSKGKVTGFPIRAVGVWETTWPKRDTYIGEWGAPAGAESTSAAAGYATSMKTCGSQWTTTLPVAAGR